MVGPDLADLTFTTLPLRRQEWLSLIDLFLLSADFVGVQSDSPIRPSG